MNPIHKIRQIFFWSVFFGIAAGLLFLVLNFFHFREEVQWAPLPVVIVVTPFTLIARNVKAPFNALHAFVIEFLIVFIFCMFYSVSSFINEHHIKPQSISIGKKDMEDIYFAFILSFSIGTFIAIITYMFRAKPRKSGDNL